MVAPVEDLSGRRVEPTVPKHGAGAAERIHRLRLCWVSHVRPPVPTLDHLVQLSKGVLRLKLRGRGGLDKHVLQPGAT
jgi:hypothetical protein